MQSVTRANGTCITELPADWPGKDGLDTRTLGMLLESAGMMLPKCKESRRSTSDIMRDICYQTAIFIRVGVIV